MTSGTERMQDAGREFADAAKDTARKIADDAKEAAQSEISALRRKVEALMAERVTPAVSKVTGQAEAFAHDAGAAVRQRAGDAANTVREQPFAAIAVAVAAGLAIGMLMRR